MRKKRVYKNECVYWWMTQITRIMDERMRQRVLEMHHVCHWSKRINRTEEENGTKNYIHAIKMHVQTVKIRLISDKIFDNRIILSHSVQRDATAGHLSCRRYA